MNIYLDRIYYLLAKKHLPNCEICGYISQLNMICLHQLPKSPKVLSNDRREKRKKAPNICGICIYCTCNAQFGIMSFQNLCMFHSKANNVNKLQQIKNNEAAIEDNLRRVMDDKGIFSVQCMKYLIQKLKKNIVITVI